MRAQPHRVARVDSPPRSRVWPSRPIRPHEILARMSDEVFRLPNDGRKWKLKCRERRILLKAVLNCDDSGTGLNIKSVSIRRASKEAGHLGLVISPKTAARRMADLRRLGFLESLGPRWNGQAIPRRRTVRLDRAGERLEPSESDPLKAVRCSESDPLKSANLAHYSSESFSNSARDAQRSWISTKRQALADALALSMKGIVGAGYRYPAILLKRAGQLNRGDWRPTVPNTASTATPMPVADSTKRGTCSLCRGTGIIQFRDGATICSCGVWNKSKQ
jgi:hypothetical protein